MHKGKRACKDCNYLTIAVVQSDINHTILPLMGLFYCISRELTYELCVVDNDRFLKHFFSVIIQIKNQVVLAVKNSRVFSYSHLRSISSIFVKKCDRSINLRPSPSSLLHEHRYATIKKSITEYHNELC
jgi:hypothetical protein